MNWIVPVLEDPVIMVREATKLVRGLAAHLPSIDHEAEARVDELMAAYDRGLRRRPLRRREAQEPATSER